MGSSDLVKSIVSKFVHEAVLHDRGSICVNSVDTIVVVVVLLYLREHTSYKMSKL